MKTVKCKIYLAVDKDGDWQALGHPKVKSDDEGFATCSDTLEFGEAHYFVEVEVPIPEPQTVTGKVTKEDGSSL